MLQVAKLLHPIQRDRTIPTPQMNQNALARSETRVANLIPYQVAVAVPAPAQTMAIHIVNPTGKDHGVSRSMCQTPGATVAMTLPIQPPRSTRTWPLAAALALPPADPSSAAL